MQGKCIWFSSECHPHLSHLQIVTVNRRPEVEEARSKLPIIAQEQEIMETINSQVEIQVKL